MHVECGDDDLQDACLHEILTSFDCSQHVPNAPTHCDGGIVDLAITNSEQVIDDIWVFPLNFIFDHSLIIWHVDFPAGRAFFNKTLLDDL